MLEADHSAPVPPSKSSLVILLPYFAMKLLDSFMQFTA